MVSVAGVFETEVFPTCRYEGAKLGTAIIIA
jgi:hypothetical protein